MERARGRAARRRGGQEGFTFVELAVAAVVVGLLAALMIPAFLGTRDRASAATAKSLLRTGASAVEAASVHDGGYEVLTPAGLRAAEPAVAWLGAPGAAAERDEISVTGLGPGTYTLTTTAPNGTVFVLRRDQGMTPAVVRSCGPGCSW